MTKNETSKEALLVMQALRQLEIDVPVMHTRLVGDRVELFLYGGRVVTFPEDAPAPTPKTETKPKSKSPAASRSGKNPRNPGVSKKRPSNSENCQ